MISTDRSIFQEGSAVRARQIEYAKNYDEVHIIVFSGKEFTEQSIAPNCWIYPTRSAFKLMRPLNASRLAHFIVKKRGITEVTCQDASFTALTGISVKKKFNLPLEIQVHEDLGSPYYGFTIGRKVRKSLALTHLKQADSIRVVSNRIRDYLISIGIDSSKVTVRPIAVDIDSIKNAPITVDLHRKYPQFEKIILMASRLEAEKNIELAISAFKEVVQKNPKAGLIIVGKGSQLSHLKSLCLRLSLKDSVVFESWVDKQTLVSYYKTADVFLNTSLFEGYGMTLVEAHAAGCKIVSTNVGIAPEVGVILVEHEVKDVAAKIIGIL